MGSIVRKIIVVGLLGLLASLSIALTSGLYFLVIVGFFNTFNVEYDTIGSILLFVLYIFFVSLLTDFLGEVTYKLSSIYSSGKYKLIAVGILWEVFFAWIALYTIDEIMDAVTIPFLTEVALAFVLAASEFVFSSNKKRELQ